VVFVLAPLAASGQPTSLLHIRVSLADAAGTATPIARHVLLVSDNPATAPPRSVTTAPDGTADVKLPAGNYTVESDQPVVFQGKAYHWTQAVDIVAGRDTVLDLTIGNAEVERNSSSGAAQIPDAPPRDRDGTGLISQWQDSVVALWTATARASGFVVDAKGLVATSQRVVGNATSLEVQLTPEIKVTGRVITAEPGRDVAIIRIDPAALGAVVPVTLGCDAAAPAPTPRQQVFALGAPLREPKGAFSGTLGRVGPHALETDLDPPDGSAGGPALTEDGTFIGLASVVDGSDERHPDFRIVRTGDVCASLASAVKAMADTPPPSGAHLPVEPTHPFPTEALEAAAKKAGGRPVPYQASSSDFDLAFITPGLIYASQHKVRPTSLPARSGRTRVADPLAEARQEALLEFGRWSDYFADARPVLLVRATPKMVEGFWKAVARGAAQTQGMSLPALKHFKAGFLRMQAFCGAAEVLPIHPFTLDRPVSETSTIAEGLYVFDPGALGPQCGTVKLVLYSEKAPTQADTFVVDSGLIQQVWQDFAPMRSTP